MPVDANTYRTQKVDVSFKGDERTANLMQDNRNAPKNNRTVNQ